MPTIVSFLLGLLFGVGLLVSGMANPAKVLGFLDLAGPWDPSLAFVMAGAIAIGAIGFRIARTRSRSLLDLPMQIPGNRTIDRRLLVGGVLFGAGWGLAGFCPGPAVVALGAGQPKAAAFVIAMLVGMGLFELIERRARATPPPQPRAT
ncbi:MAG: YeeE/YedE family protein [Casimicrobiaceae bacterium]